MKRVIYSTFGLLIIVICGAFLLLQTPDTNKDAMVSKYANAASNFIELPTGDKIHYRDNGTANAPVLILIHGANSSLQAWEPLTERLQTKYRVVSLDLPGHGLSGPRIDRDYSASVQTKTVITVMDELGIESGIWVGNSMGGWLTWRSAITHPERTQGIVLISPSGAPRDEPAKIYLGGRLMHTKLGQILVTKFMPRSIIESSIKANFHNSALVTEDMIDRYWELLRFPGNRLATVDRYNTDREPEKWNLVSKIDVPVLILWGESDTVIPVSLAQKFSSKIKNTEVISYPSVGHLAMEEVPDQVAMDLDMWVDNSFSNPQGK